MKIITISREFGSGGRELGKRLADHLDVDYYDHEIITAIAREKGMGEAYVEKALEGHAWRSIPLTCRHSFTGGAILREEQTSLLLAQKRVIDGIARGPGLRHHRAKCGYPAGKVRAVPDFCLCGYGGEDTALHRACPGGGAPDAEGNRAQHPAD